MLNKETLLAKFVNTTSILKRLDVMIEVFIDIRNLLENIDYELELQREELGEE